MIERIVPGADPRTLRQQIEAAGVPMSGANINYAESPMQAVGVHFPDTLTQQQITTLDSTIASHVNPSPVTRVAANQVSGLGPLATATPPGGTATFLRADGTWASPPGGSQAFPVGAVFISVVPTNPASLLGYGTWVAIGAGRVLVGLDATNPSFDAAEETGGALTVAAAGTNAAEAAHTHGVTPNVAVADHASHTHTYTQVPNHVHVEQAQGGTTASTTGTHLMTSAATGGNLRASAASTANPTGGVATGTTNGPSATLSHGVTNNPVTSGAGSSHNHAFTGAPTSVVQPYFVVFMFKRTA